VKKIEAIIKPFKLEEVMDALEQTGVEGMTVLEVRGCGRECGQYDALPGAKGSSDYLPKLKLEIVVADEDLDEVLTAIVRSARTGRLGDGKIFVSDVEQAVRIRTSETGETAIKVGSELSTQS